MPRSEPSLSDLMRAWRAARGLNTAETGQRLGMSPRTIEGIEQGRAFRYEKILRLALKALD